QGRDAFALAEAVSAALAQELGAPPPPPIDFSTPSPVARRLHDEGLRAYYQGDRTGALRLFRAALAEDSTFAMAALFAARAADFAEPAAALALSAQAVRMSRR